MMTMGRMYEDEGSDATASEIVGLASALLLSDEERDRIFLSKMSQRVTEM